MGCVDGEPPGGARCSGQRRCRGLQGFGYGAIPVVDMAAVAAAAAAAATTGMGCQQRLRWKAQCVSGRRPWCQMRITAPAGRSCRRLSWAAGSAEHGVARQWSSSPFSRSSSSSLLPPCLRRQRRRAVIPEERAGEGARAWLRAVRWARPPRRAGWAAGSVRQGARRGARWARPRRGSPLPCSPPRAPPAPAAASPAPPYAPTPRRSALPMELPNTCRAAPSLLPTPFPTPRLSPHPTPWLTHAPVPNM